MTTGTRAAPAQAAPQEPVAEPLTGWKFNHARRHPDPDQGGAWEIGFLDDEDDRFSPIVTVDTGFHYQNEQAEPLARAILAKLAAQPAPARQPLTAAQATRLWSNAPDQVRDDLKSCAALLRTLRFFESVYGIGDAA